MINESWFRKYQKTLLFFLKFKWFRRLLQIETDEKIIGILPHCYTVHLGGQRLKTDFRTRPTFARNLYKAFKAIFLAMHTWDLIADPMVPKLSFGLSSLTVNPVPGSTVDGWVRQSFTGDNSWSTLRNGAGDGSNYTDLSNFVWDFVDMSVPATGWNVIYRSIFLFDTSPLGAGATFNSAIFSIYINSKANQHSSTWSPAMGLVSSNPASNTVLANSDYATLGTTEFATRIAYANITTSAYNDMTMNATGLAAISLTGITKLGIREANYDIDDVDPGATGGFLGTSATGTYSDAGSNEPKLVIDYIAATMILARPIYT